MEEAPGNVGKIGWRRSTASLRQRQLKINVGAELPCDVAGDTETETLVKGDYVRPGRRCLQDDLLEAAIAGGLAKMGEQLAGDAAPAAIRRHRHAHNLGHRRRTGHQGAAADDTVAVAGDQEGGAGIALGDVI